MKAMSHSVVTLLLICAVVTLLNCGASGNQKPTPYGSITRYKKGKPIRFADFTLEFIGERPVSTPQYPRGFHYYDFKIKTASEEKVISWTAGTGDIGPTEFEIAGKTFLLERAHSDKLGQLKENELVIWEK